MNTKKSKIKAKKVFNHLLKSAKKQKISEKKLNELLNGVRHELRRKK